MARLIRAGKKWQERRPMTIARPKPGKTVAVQPGRGQAAACRIRVLGVVAATAGDVTFDGARAEGYATTDDLKVAWVRQHEPGWVEQWNGTEQDWNLIERFDEKHAGRPVWVITFELDRTDTPRLLAARPARAQSDYVSNPAQAMRDEPEALSRDEYRRHVDGRRRESAEDRQEAYDRARELDRRLLSREDRVRKIERDARARGIDLTGELWLLRRRMVRSSGGNVEQRLQRLEARVDRVAV